MTNKNPKDNEINIAILTERLSNFMENTENSLAKILEQTTKTNGRVNELEKEVEEIKTWRKYTIWVGGAIVGIVTFVINKLVK